VRTLVWPKEFLDPVFRKEKQEAMGEEEFKQLAFSPVRAIRSNVSSSVFYDSTMFRLESHILREGKRQVARDLLHKIYAEIKQTQMEKMRSCKSEEEKAAIELNPIVIIKEALENMKPVVITKSIKRGGATYQVPHPVTPKYSEYLAIKWLLNSVKERPKPRKESFYVVMAREILSAYNNEGKVVKKKLDVHRQCEANKAYAHYRWG